MNFYELLLNRGQPSGEGMTHFERLFAAKLAGGGGEIKELEGVPPLLFKADGTPLIDWIIYGNMQQSGTPTPQNPIMPQGTGERTGNLFDEVYSDISSTLRYRPIFVGDGTFTLSTTTPYDSSVANVFLLSGNVSSGASTPGNGAWKNHNVTAQSVDGYVTIAYRHYSGTTSPVDCQTMLNTGSTPLPYEPYGYKIPISSANTTTPVYLGEIESTRRIKKLVLTGEETYRKQDSSSTVSLYAFTVPEDTVSRDNVICSHLPFSYNYSTEISICFYSDLRNLFLNFGLDVMNAQPSGNTVAGLKEYLAAQYAAGTPVTVWYILATEKTGIVNEPLMRIGDYADTLSMEQAGVEIPTIKGNNTLDIETTLKPSNVYIKYKT